MFTSFNLILLIICLLIMFKLVRLEHNYEDEDIDLDIDYSLFNSNDTKPGQFLGSYCIDNTTCNPYLRNVYCNSVTHKCECLLLYPVQLSLRKGCAKAVLLGEQCFYDESCRYTDTNAECIQIHHNAQCKCKRGFHSVSASKPNRREFCSKDLVVIKSDLQTLLGVASGLAIFTAAICFVLKLFVGSKPRSFGDANISTPIIYSSNNAIPLRSSSLKRGSRSPSAKSMVVLGDAQQYIRRGSNGILVTSTRAGAAHAAALLLYSCSQIANTSNGASRNNPNSRRCSSISPVHSNHSANSFKSYSAKRFERDIEMRLKAAKRRQESTLSLAKPKSTDKLLDEMATTGEEEEEPTTKPDSVHITIDKPLSLPFAKAQSLGHPLSLPFMTNDNMPSTSKAQDFDWITTPT